MKTFSAPELNTDLIDDGQTVTVSFDSLVTSIKTDNGRVSIGRQQWKVIIEKSLAFDRMITAADLPDLVRAETEKKEAPEIGTPFHGGFYAGMMTQDGKFYALIVAPKSDGETRAKWKTTYTGTPGASSTFDGRFNSGVMNDADHPAAQFCRALTIDGHDDWYLPSKDELEILYRNLAPSKTSTPFFRIGGAQAFEPRWYWSSTEFDPGYAWLQGFGDGTQGDDGKDYASFVRAVRKVLI
jgi:hypothetical protein